MPARRSMRRRRQRAVRVAEVSIRPRTAAPSVVAQRHRRHHPVHAVDAAFRVVNLVPAAVNAVDAGSTAAVNAGSSTPTPPAAAASAPEAPAARVVRVEQKILLVDVLLRPVPLVLQRGDLHLGRRRRRERVRQQPVRRGPRLRVPLQTQQHELARVRGEERRDLRQLHRARDLVQHLHLPAAVAPRRLPGRHLEHGAPDRPHVRLGAVTLLADDLRGHPVRAAFHAAARARGGVVDAFHERLRHAEIREFYPSALLD
eukprot:30626-Pelagococcus_subviridis.AAC.5